MNFTIEKTTFIDALTPAMSTVSTKNTITSLEGVLIDCRDDLTMSISSYDMKKGVVSNTVTDTVTESGRYIVPAQKLMQIIRLMPDGPVNVNVDAKETATISSLTGHFSLKAQKGEDFPSLPEMTGDRSFTVKAGILKRMIGKIIHSIAENDIKAMLCGAYFLVDNEGLEVVSCNNFMLSKCRMKCELKHIKQTGEENFSFIVPGHALNELIKLLPDSDDDVYMELTKKYGVFKFGALMFFTRLIEESYMDYHRIIPTGYPIRVKINRALLTEGLERVNLIADEKDQSNSRSYVKINVEGSLFQMSAISATGNAFEEIACEHDGDSLAIGFNGKFLISCIRVIESEDVVIMMKSENKSITIEPAENKEGEELFYLVLPLRMNS